MPLPVGCPAPHCDMISTMDDSRTSSPDHSVIDTPCIKICVVEPETGYCIGCGRTRSEIGGWLAMSQAERRALMATLPERVATLTLRKTRRGGRRGRLGMVEAG